MAYASAAIMNCSLEIQELDRITNSYKDFYLFTNSGILRFGNHKRIPQSDRQIKRLKDKS
jgi:hypothetical protein